jgi:hypothetical protein
VPSLRNGLLTHIDRHFWFDAGAPGNPVTLCGADQDPGAYSHLQHEDFHPNYFPGISSSVVDPWVRASHHWIRIRLFLSLTFKTPTKSKTKYFCLLLFEGTLTSFFWDKKS